MSRDAHLALVLDIGISKLRGHVLITLLIAHIVAERCRRLIASYRPSAEGLNGFRFRLTC